MNLILISCALKHRQDFRFFYNVCVDTEMLCSRNYRHFHFLQIYQNISHVLSRSLRLVQWKENRATIIINNHLMMEEEEGAFRYVLLETDKDIADAVVHEFPIFEREFVENVVKQWRQLCRTHSC